MSRDRRWSRKRVVLPAVLAAAFAATALAAPGASAAYLHGGGGVPAFDPASFVRTIDNPWFPLVPGTTFVYRGETDEGPERNIVKVTRKTKTILGVKARVVLDVVWIGGRPVERTLDWYAQDRHGNVWYLGEDSRDFEDGEWVRSPGSWEAGVDGAMAGIVMWANPLARRGQTYQQELYVGHAEDRARVIGLRRWFTTPYATYKRTLAIREWTPLEPDVVERKFYARGLGFVAARQHKGGSDTLSLVAIRRP